MLSVQLPESRTKKRFSFQRPFAAAFAGKPIALLDLSQEGAQVGHEEQLPLNSESVLELTVTGMKTISLRGVAVWTRDSGQEFPRRSGIRITESRLDLAADVLDYFVRLRKVRFDKESLSRKPAVAEPRLQIKRIIPLSTEKQQRVRQALLFLTQPGRMTDFWLGLAESTKVETNLQHPLEVIAAWELLDRGIDIDQVAEAARS